METEMALLKIAKLGKPVLRKIAKPVTQSEYHTPAFQLFLENMVETMRAVGAVGLAAPQVYNSKRVIVLEKIGKPGKPGDPEMVSFPLMIILNPVISFTSEDKIEGLEGCVSLDNLRGKVQRAAKVTVQGFDRRMQPIEINAEGHLAVVLQHEIDHLDGKVFIDRMTDLASLSLRSVSVNQTSTQNVSLYTIDSSRKSSTVILLPEHRPTTQTQSLFELHRYPVPVLNSLSDQYVWNQNDTFADNSRKLPAKSGRFDLK